MESPKPAVRVYTFALMPPTPKPTDCDWAILSAKNTLTGLAMFFDDMVKDGKQLGDWNDQVKRELEEWYQRGEARAWFESSGKQYAEKLRNVKKWAIDVAKWIDDMLEIWNKAAEEVRRTCYEEAR